ncbi:MAG TPA: type III-B CRISPR module RAMP protein Cmr4 [Stellaceae bacterium]|jgi:CRISPR-associated protein Cmr4
MPETTLLFLHALTAMHPGSGTALGIVDLPVQRERHSGWPTIPSTSLKGVLKAEARATGKLANGELAALFGPETNNADEHAGAIAFTDARLLAFPVRSLKGVFAWVTCPEAISRLRRDLALTQLGKLPAVPDGGGRALVAKGSPLCQQSSLVLEEFAFDNVVEGADAVAGWIADNAFGDGDSAERLKKRLVVVGDNEFGHFVQHATEVTARIALNYETKTVREGALFYEEFLPAETLFYSVVLAEKSRRSKDGMQARYVLKTLVDLPLATIQIGAGETIGKGLCAIRFASAEGTAA